MKTIHLELTDKEFEDLGAVIVVAWDSLDFHGDLIPMEIPLKKLAKELQLDESYWKEENE